MLHTRKGTNSSTDLYWGEGWYVWNNTGVPPWLANLRDSGLEIDVVCGVMLAHGASASSIKKLQRLAKKA